jgi:ABC-type antimicrobial peptide transport system permease subunit
LRTIGFILKTLNRPAHCIIRKWQLSRWPAIFKKRTGDHTVRKGSFPDAVYKYDFLDEQIAKFYEQDYIFLRLIRIFSDIAIVIGCIGLYGLVSFMVTRKTKEVGIRKVLGASVQSIVWLFGREFFLLLLIAFAIAAPLATWVMNNWLENFAYRVNIGTGTFLLTVFISMAVAMLTVGYKSVKAALMSPVRSLRSE